MTEFNWKQPPAAEMPENIKAEMSCWRKGFGDIRGYNEWHEGLANADLDRLESIGIKVHNRYVASDGWGDGCKFIHAVVELANHELIKIKWSDCQRWYSEGHGWGLMRDEDFLKERGEQKDCCRFAIEYKEQYGGVA